MVPAITISIANGDEVTRGAPEEITLPPPSEPLPMRSTPIKPTSTTESNSNLQ